MSTKEENPASIEDDKHARNENINENVHIDNKDKPATLKHDNNFTKFLPVSITLEKIARSIGEIQQNITNIADVLIFLEIFGYDDKLAEKMGYSDLVNLAQTIYPYIHFYSEEEKRLLQASNVKSERRYSNEKFHEKCGDSLSLEISKASQIKASETSQTRESTTTNTQDKDPADLPTRNKRVIEGIGMALPWLGSLLVLYTTGVSLWMSGILSTTITTFFLGGVLIGLIASEGISQISIRQFSFYYNQQNYGEIKRIIVRHYVLSAIVGGSLALIISFVLLGYPSMITGSHFDFKNTFGEYGKDMAVMISVFGMVSIIIHRSSFMIIYAMRKISYAALAYGCGLSTLILFFYFLAPLITSNTTSRYFISLIAAFVTLTVFASISHISLLRQNGSYRQSAKTEKNKNRKLPNFYSPPSFSKYTLRSNYNIQWWEGGLYFIYGIAFFLILFEDRLISWTHFSNGMLAIMFNSIYHLGADIAFALLLITGILQYIQLSPLYTEINNLASRTEITKIKNISKFLLSRYKSALIWCIIASGAIITIFCVIGPAIIESIGYGQPIDYFIFSENHMHTKSIGESVTIMKIMLVSYAILSIFTINSIFIMLLNRMKYLIIVLIIAVTIDTVIGLSISEIMPFENAALGSLIANAFLTSTSTVYIVRILRNGDIASLFSRFS